MAIIDVITVCLNDLPNLKSTWESLRRQTCISWQWIVVDGDSRDGTKAWLGSQRAMRPDKQIIFKSEKDNGLYDAMNKGLQLSTGEYVIFMNSGDYFASNIVLDKVTRYINKGTIDIAYGDAQEKFPDGKILSKKARSKSCYWYGMFTHHQAMFFRRDFIGEIRFKLKYAIGADYAFVCELMRKGPVMFRLRFPVCVFLADGLSSTPFGQSLGYKEQMEIKKSILGMSKIQVASIGFVQRMMIRIRRYFPKIYYCFRRMRENKTQLLLI
jgi:putative colanic acid biosynthesis glycosyltransferase